MCKCETGKNIAGGWAFIPCNCEEAEYKKQHYKNVILPRRMKQIAEMEARLNENGRAAHA